MLDGPLVFVDVDTQRDFLDTDGALAIAGAEAIRPNLARLTAHARAGRIPIIATACAHAAADREADFPPHCVVGTPGQERVAETLAAETWVVEPGSGAVPEGVPLHLTIHKRAYDVFSTPEAEAIFRVAGREAPLFVVYGVATDYCVRCVVEGLLARHHRVAVVADATRAVEADHEADHLTRFTAAGAVLTLTDVVCAG